MSTSIQSIGTVRSPRLFKRHLLVLALLRSFGGSVGRTDFQKLLFLYCQEQHSPYLSTTKHYEFVPYRYGAYSLTCDADLRRLRKQGLLSEGENWKLTEKGRSVGEKFLDGTIREFSSRYADKRGNRLIKETYEQFPYYATRSEKAEVLFKDDPGTLQLIKDSRPKAAPAALFTIGYEGKQLEEYLNLLLRSSVTILCDVRSNPISRKYGFSKTTLSQICSKLNIRYEHLPKLGVESKDRRGLQSQVEFKSLFRAYKKSILESQTNNLEAILNWISSGEIVALTCFENEHMQCHRHCVVAALEEMPNKQAKLTYEVAHL